jgi:hypothetical protein
MNYFTPFLHRLWAYRDISYPHNLESSSYFHILSPPWLWKKLRYKENAAAERYRHIPVPIDDEVLVVHYFAVRGLQHVQ